MRGLGARHPAGAISLIFLLAALALMFALTERPEAPAFLFDGPSGSSRIRSDYTTLPLTFAPERGRRGGGRHYVASIERSEVVLGPGGARIYSGGRGGHTQPIGISLAGGDLTHPVARAELPGPVDDLRDAGPSRRRSGSAYREIVYRDAYPGVDLAFHGRSGALEFDLRLDPGADPGRIDLAFTGVRPRLTFSGELLLDGGGSSIRVAAPQASQAVDGRRTVVTSEFTLDGSHVGFALGDYDSSRPLVIDPS